MKVSKEQALAMKQEIDRITHGTLDQIMQDLIWELVDQGYTYKETREYFQMKHLDILRSVKDIHTQYWGDTNDDWKHIEKDAEQKHWENLTTHFERFTD